MYINLFIQHFAQRTKHYALPFAEKLFRFFSAKRMLSQLLISCCFFVWLSQLSGIFVYASEFDDRYEHFYLEASYQKEFGLIILSLMCEKGAPAAGIFLQIIYDNKIMSFTSAQKGSAKKELEFTCSLQDNGKINILLDGTQNDSGSGVIATFCFGLKDSANAVNADFYFGLECSATDSFFYISQGKFYTLNAVLDGCNLKTDCSEEQLKVLYAGFSQRLLSESEVCLRLTGVISGNMFEESGFEIYIVDLCDGSVSKQTLSRKKLLYNLYGTEYTPQDFGGKYFYTSDIVISGKNLVCIYIRPYAVYNGYRMYGAEYVQLFSEGRYTGY